MSKKQLKSSTFTEVKGDALDLFFKSKTDAVFMHGANCQQVMGAGIANQVRQQLAPLYYLDQYDTRNPTQRFGSYSAVVVGQVEDKIKIGVNLYSQFETGANFDSNAFRNSLRAFCFSLPTNRENFTIYIPQIGCGIGGGDWNDVKSIVKMELRDFNVVVVEYVKPIENPEK
jgi:O-acetyl-ADP-ribose deacetylase (regulator of RNase III)